MYPLVLSWAALPGFEDLWIRIVDDDHIRRDSFRNGIEVHFQVHDDGILLLHGRVRQWRTPDHVVPRILEGVCPELGDKQSWAGVYWHRSRLALALAFSFRFPFPLPNGNRFRSGLTDDEEIDSA